MHSLIKVFIVLSLLSLCLDLAAYVEPRLCYRTEIRSETFADEITLQGLKMTIVHT